MQVANPAIFKGSVKVLKILNLCYNQSSLLSGMFRNLNLEIGMKLSKKSHISQISQLNLQS